MTSAGLAALADLEQLKSLNLEGDQIDDSGIAHILKMTNLVNLNLSGTQVTAQGVLKLKTLADLKQLKIQFRNFSSDDDARIDATLPGVTVVR